MRSTTWSDRCMVHDFYLLWLGRPSCNSARLTCMGLAIQPQVLLGSHFSCHLRIMQHVSHTAESITNAHDLVPSSHVHPRRRTVHRHEMSTSMRSDQERSSVPDSLPDFPARPSQSITPLCHHSDIRLVSCPRWRFFVQLVSKHAHGRGFVADEPDHRYNYPTPPRVCP